MAYREVALAVFLSQGVTSLEAVQAVRAAGAKSNIWTDTEKRVLSIMVEFFSKR
jgi:hypothetical protein